ncbi:uncharacterized protein TNIN_294311 [Trichonephila inaurata madagascariensis]|uniref:Uncharacterized protein n=1 Tax=Trichonephila inaurata madagascariensis TaxID=2747483 RepID=A0A8X6IQ70_9ARAC|nr:uncharacterized protein TNIN_294311 [Trichonephila inaurata madagascariensis]
MDEDWSLFALLTVLNGLIALFWNIYIVTFHINLTFAQFSSLACSVIIFPWFKFLILVSATTTNELIDKTNNIVRCVTYRIPTPQQGLRRLLKENLTRENHLTLWKIYVMDRPLVITCFGSLLTYGMLLGTLGKPS